MRPGKHLLTSQPLVVNTLWLSWEGLLSTPVQCAAHAAACSEFLDFTLDFRAMTKTLDSTALYAYTTLISVLICTPLALLAEGSALAKGEWVFC